MVGEGCGNEELGDPSARGWEPRLTSRRDILVG